MTREQYLTFHKQCMEKMSRITQAKSRDYAGDGDPFANFSRVSQMGITSVEKGFLVRMTDKLSRLATFTNTGKMAVLDESVEDTLLDLANYSILLAGYLKSKEENTIPSNIKGGVPLVTDKGDA